MEAYEGLKLEVLQLVSIQGEHGQAVQRRQRLGVYLADVVAAQLKHLPELNSQ